MSKASRNTLSLGLNMEAGVLLWLQQYTMFSCAFWIVDFASLMAILIYSMNSLMVSSAEGHCLGLKSIWGFQPVLSRKDICWVKV